MNQQSFGETLAEFGSILLPGSTPDDVRNRLTVLAARTLGADGVGMTTANGHGYETVTFTDPWVVEVDAIQYDLERGPCLEGIRESKIVSVENMAGETRWLPFPERAASLGVQSVLSLPLAVGDVRAGALNVYSKEPYAFQTSEEIAYLFTAPAAAAITNAEFLQDIAHLSKQLESALESRGIIERARGIIMAKQKVPADEAFAAMKRESQNTNRKLRDVAQEIVDRAVNA